MAVEVSTGAPPPPIKPPGEQGKMPEVRGPQGGSLATPSAPEGVPMLPTLDRSPMRRVWLGAPGEEPPTGALLTFTDVPQRLVDPKAPILEPSHMEPEFQEQITLDPNYVPSVRQQERVTPVTFNPDVEEGSIWDQYSQGNKGIVTIVGRNTAKGAFKANKGTLELMANGDIPTPDELVPVVAAYKVSDVRGRDAFEDFYSKKLAG